MPRLMAMSTATRGDLRAGAKRNRPRSASQPGCPDIGKPKAAPPIMTTGHAVP